MKGTLLQVTFSLSPIRIFAIVQAQNIVMLHQNNKHCVCQRGQCEGWCCTVHGGVRDSKQRGVVEKFPFLGLFEVPLYSPSLSLYTIQHVVVQDSFSAPSRPASSSPRSRLFSSAPSRRRPSHDEQLPAVAIAGVAAGALCRHTCHSGRTELEGLSQRWSALGQACGRLALSFSQPGKTKTAGSSRHQVTRSVGRYDDPHVAPESTGRTWLERDRSPVTQTRV
jgi:hypothetical protein